MGGRVIVVIDLNARRQEQIRGLTEATRGNQEGVRVGQGTYGGQPTQLNTDTLSRRSIPLIS